MRANLFGLTLVVILTSQTCQSLKTETSEERRAKLLPIFQVIRFPNDGCTGANRNGTCYTSEECSSKGGTQDGSCASGFGVCCVFTVSCGTTIRDNCSYLVQSALTTGLTIPCKYSVCRVGSNVCRIRYDFTIFALTGPAVGTTVATGTGGGVNAVGSIGQCVDDSFVVAAPGGPGSPLICGSNSGYHMILDASSECQTATFTINGNTGTTRSWDVKVTQYACGDLDSSGPPGCLQYYKETYGTIENFNFPTATTSLTSGITHLARQNYQVCIRRGINFCYICYTPNITPTTAIILQQSFGVSTGPSGAAIAAQSATGTACTTDFVTIPNGQTATIAAISTAIAVGIDRFCGRFFNVISGTIVSSTVCSRVIPFTIGFVADDTEVLGTPAANAAANEQTEDPGGIVGFQLMYFQQPC